MCEPTFFPRARRAAKSWTKKREVEWARGDLNAGRVHPKHVGYQTTPRAREEGGVPRAKVPFRINVREGSGVQRGDGKAYLSAATLRPYVGVWPMTRMSLGILALAILTLSAAFAPLAAGEVTADGVTFYFAPGGATAGKLLLDAPTATEAAKVVKNGPQAQKTSHEWQAAARPANMTVSDKPTVTLFVEPGASVVPIGNAPNQVPGSLYLKVTANFGGTASNIAWVTVPSGAGAKEVTAELTFAAAFPITVAPDAILSVTTEFYAAQATGAQVTYHVNATTTLSRLDVPGSIEGMEPEPLPVCQIYAESNASDCPPVNVTGNVTPENVTGNGSGNGTDNGTEPVVKTEGAATDKKKKEGGIPGFETALVAIAGIGLAFLRKRSQRRS